MNLLAGTSGYAYKEWRGSFYDPSTTDDGFLKAYSERLPAVEINNTFYRLPKREAIESWRDQVPAGFRFAVKASRRITHLGRLRGVEEETRYLMTALETLGKRLGAVLFQLPPNLPKDLPRLERFLDLLPAGTPAAFEFRHPSWIDEEVRDRITRQGGALCVTDTGDESTARALAIARDASWGYLRMRREAWSTREIQALRKRIEETAWDRAYVFFKHEEGADAPHWAERLCSTGKPRRRGR